MSIEINREKNIGYIFVNRIEKKRNIIYFAPYSSFVFPFLIVARVLTRASKLRFLNTISMKLLYLDFINISLNESNIPTMSILYYTLNNSVFTNFAFYSTASVLKLMGMAALTSMKRLSKDVIFTIKFTNVSHQISLCFSLLGLC